jgi:DNA-binding NarL/FixJ family response regulator
MDGAIRVLVADDNVAFCSGMEALLDLVDDIELVGTAHDGPGAVRLACRLQPDVVVMDMEMPGGGLQATREITPDNPQIAVLLFSMHEEDDAVMEAVLAGARGYVVKGVRQEQLLRAIRTVADGGAVFGPGIARRMIDFFAAAKEGAAASGPMAGLTDREREVLELIAKGRTNEQIAEQLALERGTVRNYTSNIVFLRATLGAAAEAALAAEPDGGDATGRQPADRGAAAGRPQDVDQAERVTFERRGDYWTIGFPGSLFRLKDAKGLQHLAALLRNPHKEFHALELVGGGRGALPVRGREVIEEGMSAGLGDAGEMLDAEAKAAYRQRIEELREELEEAESWGDPERISRAREELDFIAGELAGAVGLGGRDRVAASSAERARVNVTRAIRSAVKRIGENDSALGEHLDAAVKTGTFCSYAPEARAALSWDLAEVH